MEREGPLICVSCTAILFRDNKMHLSQQQSEKNIQKNTMNYKLNVDVKFDILLKLYNNSAPEYIYLKGQH